MDYIHYNPVEHGYKVTPSAYTWSLFAVHVAKGRYPGDWGSTVIPRDIAAMALE